MSRCSPTPHCQILVLAGARCSGSRVPARQKLIKRVSFLGRADGVTSNAIRQRMVERDDRLVKTVPVRGVQPGSRHRPHRRRRIRSVRGASCRRRRGDVSETKEAFDEYLRFPEFARLCAYSSEFIRATNAFLTETYPVALPSA